MGRRGLKVLALALGASIAASLVVADGAGAAVPAQLRTPVPVVRLFGVAPYGRQNDPEFFGLGQVELTPGATRGMAIEGLNVSLNATVTIGGATVLVTDGVSATITVRFRVNDDAVPAGKLYQWLPVTVTNPDGTSGTCEACIRAYASRPANSPVGPNEQYRYYAPEPATPGFLIGIYPDPVGGNATRTELNVAGGQPSGNTAPLFSDNGQRYIIGFTIACATPTVISWRSNGDVIASGSTQCDGATHVAALAWSIGGYTAEPLSQATFALTAVAYDTNNYKATATSPTVTIPLQNW